MDNWFSNLTAWLVDFIKGIFLALLDFIHDAALWVFDGILQAVAGVIAAVPVPSFLSSGINVASNFAGFGSYPLFVLSQLNLSACFTVLAAGISFRLLRKAATLFQW